jgi:MFS family permease
VPKSPGLICLFPIQHTILYLQRDLGLDLQRDLGLGSKTAAYAMSGTFALGIIAKLFGGWLYDRISVHGIMLFYLLLAISVALAIPIAGIASVIIFAVFRGIAHGGLIGEPPVFAKHCYGTRYMNRILPILQGAMYAGFATGPVILSRFYDHFNSYTYGLIMLVGMSLLAFGLLFFVKPLYRERVQNATRPQEGRLTDRV